MPRSARLDTPGALHHIIIRGIERRRIFYNDHDRKDFIKRLASLIPETKTTCYAWALMPNHAHFLLRSGPEGIGKFMMRLLTGYVVGFNLRHQRHGQLFQNRYKSIICQEDVYLRELVRYIHLNPMRGKTINEIEELNRYHYCGHSALMGNVEREWQDTEYVLKLFANKVKESRARYNDFIREGISQGRRPELVGGGLIRSLGGWEELKKRRHIEQERIKGDERILGDSDFVSSILDEYKENLNRRYELKLQGYSLEKVEERVAELLGIERELIFSKGRTRLQAEAKGLFCYWAVKYLGIKATEIAKGLGMSQPAIGYAVNRGEETAKKKGYKLDG